MSGSVSKEPNLPLSGLRILILEDEMILALDLSDIVESFGCTAILASRVAKALALAATQSFDAGILDLNVAGESAYPVADELSRRGVPFVIATGYTTENIAAAYRCRPILSKPYAPHQIESALRQALMLKKQ